MRSTVQPEQNNNRKQIRNFEINSHHQIEMHRNNRKQSKRQNQQDTKEHSITRKMSKIVYIWNYRWKLGIFPLFPVLAQVNRRAGTSHSVELK